MSNTLLILCVITVSIMTGCAEITPPSPQEVLESPFGKGPLRIGMTKEEVRSLWGEPDSIEQTGADQWGTPKEVWLYIARFPGVIPIDVGYASKNKYLEFDGANLISFHD